MGIIKEIIKYICPKNCYKKTIQSKVIFNNILVIFENHYSTNGHGLHSFIDSEQSQYVYS